MVWISDSRRCKLKTNYIKKDLYLSLNENAQKSDEMSEGDWDILDRKALGAIQLFLALTVAFNVSREKGPLEDVREIFDFK